VTVSVTVVALLTPKPGLAPQVAQSFREVSPLVHQEPGCELYAAHTDGSVVIMVESWTTQADLDAHAAGAPLARLNELNAVLLVKPYDVWMLDSVPLGDPTRGTISLTPLY
jgi:quinol monooxygenase YgiN